VKFRLLHSYSIFVATVRLFLERCSRNDYHCGYQNSSTTKLEVAHIDWQCYKYCTISLKCYWKPSSLITFWAYKNAPKCTILMNKISKFSGKGTQPTPHSRPRCPSKSRLTPPLLRNPSWIRHWNNETNTMRFCRYVHRRFKLIFRLIFLLIDIPDRRLIDLKQCNEITVIL